MRKPKKGDKVAINVGKHQGSIGMVTDDSNIDGRVLVQIPGLSYERAYLATELTFQSRSDEYLTSGESRRRRLQKLVREGKVCPSWPHSCTGNCEAAQAQQAEAK